MSCCRFVGNRGLCGVQIDSTCKDDGSPGNSSSSGRAACFSLIFHILILSLLSFFVSVSLINDVLSFHIKYFY